MIVVATLILATVLLTHVYVHRRLVRDTTSGRGVWWWIGTVLTALFPVFTVGALITGSNGEPLQDLPLFGESSSVLLVLLLYLTATLLVGEIVRAVLGRRARGDFDRSRRLFISRMVAFGATVIALPLTYASTMVGNQRSNKPRNAVEVAFPFTGRWLTENSPARRVPSHGTDMFGGAYAIDFVRVDEAHRTAPTTSWRTFLGTEPPEIFHAFGRPLLAPASGRIVAVHDGEPDHEARRSRLALVPYALTQGQRLREGINAIAGNHIVMQLDGGQALALAHLKQGSIRVSRGERVTEGDHIGDCGNSGNSTQPHVHMQVMDSTNIDTARGVPMVFRRFREWSSPHRHGEDRKGEIPDEGVIVEPI
jgi:murein DD-endopeptidase MepM/ murein hydrolase activator NlpD